MDELITPISLMLARKPLPAPAVDDDEPGSPPGFGFAGTLWAAPFFASPYLLVLPLAFCLFIDGEPSPVGMEGGVEVGLLVVGGVPGAGGMFAFWIGLSLRLSLGLAAARWLRDRDPARPVRALAYAPRPPARALGLGDRLVPALRLPPTDPGIGRRLVPPIGLPVQSMGNWVDAAIRPTGWAPAVPLPTPVRLGRALAVSPVGPPGSAYGTSLPVASRPAGARAQAIGISPEIRIPRGSRSPASATPVWIGPGIAHPSVRPRAMADLTDGHRPGMFARRADGRIPRSGWLPYGVPLAASSGDISSRAAPETPPQLTALLVGLARLMVGSERAWMGFAGADSIRATRTLPTQSGPTPKGSVSPWAAARMARQRTGLPALPATRNAPTGALGGRISRAGPGLPAGSRSRGEPVTPTAPWSHTPLYKAIALAPDHQNLPTESHFRLLRGQAAIERMPGSASRLWAETWDAGRAVHALSVARPPGILPFARTEPGRARIGAAVAQGFARGWAGTLMGPARLSSLPTSVLGSAVDAAPASGAPLGGTLPLSLRMAARQETTDLRLPIGPADALLEAGSDGRAMPAGAPAAPQRAAPIAASRAAPTPARPAEGPEASLRRARQPARASPRPSDTAARRSLTEMLYEEAQALKARGLRPGHEPPY